MTLQLHIQPVYSEYHSEYKVGGTRLLKHQVETLEGFRDPDIDVIFNTAMTGDGKSLAAYLPAFQDERHVIAMYPTNELIRDQHQALPKYEQRLDIRLPHNDTMFGAKITQLMREHDAVERLEEVRKLIRHNPILLTNPDLVHLMMSLQYGWGHKRKELPYELGVQFDYLLCDEFHVFAIPQIIAVTNMLGYLATLYQHRPTDRKKFLFLSATPNALFDKLLERGGLRYKRVKGSYRSSEQDGYRRILQPCELELHEIGQERRTEQWIEEHLDEIRDFFHTYPGSKGAILVNSVATARRLVALLKERLERAYGISIGENTGLTDPEERRRSFEKTILVGTSTVDIGVDFRINYLIFEAYGAGSFIQRFGRLGRHEGYPVARGAASHLRLKHAVYRACALVPRFVLERFAQRFGEGVEVEREAFNKAVYEIFPTEAEFKRYTHRWGVVQAAQVVAELKKLKDENTAFVDAMMQRYEQFYGRAWSGFSSEIETYGAGDAALPVMSKALKKYWRIEKHLPEILAELVSFRGLSPLSCGVWDSDGHVQTYDLFFLLSNTEFEVIDKQEFMQQVRAKQADEREFEHQLLYIRVSKYIEERQSLILRVNLDLVQQGIYIHNVMVMEDITVLEPRATWLNEVNRALKRKKLVCIISRMKPAELKAGLRLGMLFQVVRLEDQVGSQYSIAFGQEALLLETELFFREDKGGGAMML